MAAIRQAIVVDHTQVEVLIQAVVALTQEDLATAVGIQAVLVHTQAVPATVERATQVDTQEVHPQVRTAVRQAAHTVHQVL